MCQFIRLLDRLGQMTFASSALIPWLSHLRVKVKWDTLYNLPTTIWFDTFLRKIFYQENFDCGMK